MTAAFRLSGVTFPDTPPKNSNVAGEERRLLSGWCARHGLSPGGAACAEHAKSSTDPAGGTVS